MNERAMKEFERKKFYKLKEILLSQNDGSSNNKNNNKNMNDEEVAKDWKIETKERKSGTSQGKFDCYFIDSRTNERYRSIAEVQKMLKTRNNHVHVVDNSRHEHKHNSSQNPENDDLGEQVIENKNKKTVMNEDLMSDGKRKEKNNHDCDDDNDDHRARKILKPTIEVPVPIIRTAASKAGIAIVSDEDELDAFEEEEEEVPPQFCGSQRKSAEDARSELLRRAGINPSSSKSSFGNRRKSNVGSGINNNNNNNNNNNSNNSSAVLAQRRVQTITPTTTTTPNRFATVATDAIGKRVSHQQMAPTLATTTASRGSGSSIQKYYQQQEEQKNNTLNNYNNYEKKKNKSINNNNINSKKDWTKLNGDSSAAVRRNNGSSNDDSFMNDIDPEVAFERQKLKERFEDKEALKKKEQDELLEQQGRDNNNNNNNNNNRSALPKKYEHLASIFNGLKMCSELLRMRQSAQTVENICQCVQNVVRRDVKLEHLLKIETVKPGTFLFTKKAAFVLAASKRTTTTTTMTNNNKNNDKNEFKISQQQQQQNTIDPKSIRIDIIQSALQTTNNDKKEFENLRQADFRNRLMRICDDAYLAFCQKNGIELSMMDTTTQTTATEPTLWNDKFNIEIEAPEIAICRIRDPAFVLISNTIDKEPLSTKAQTNSSIGSPFVVVSNNGDGLGEQQQQQQPQQQHQTALMMTPFPAVKVVTERDIDDEVRRLQRTNSTNSQLFTNNDCFGDDGNDDYDDKNMHEDGSLNASLVTMGGVSRLAIRKVLERKFEKDALHSPSAVALRAETKIKQNLPKIFDLVHSLFVTSRRSVFVFETLLDKTKEQLNLDAGAYSRDEIEDCLRTLAKTCGEWCKIERAGDNTELFRLTTAVPSSARPTAPCPAPTTNEHQNGNNNKSSHVIFEGVAKRTKHKLLENSKNTQTPSFVGVFHQHLNTQRNRFL